MNASALRSPSSWPSTLCSTARCRWRLIYPKNYEAKPEPFQFIKDVPTDWEETDVLHARIGDFVTIARKDRHSGDWYPRQHH